jgi:organic hydroperoxide reductase OsmC/OhrA
MEDLTHMAAPTFPHRYQVSATAGTDGDVMLLADGVRPLRTAAPELFGGPGDRWSPETLLVGAVTDCFVLTFRAIAKATKLRWDSLECETDGTLDRHNRVPEFTAFSLRAYLRIPHDANKDEALRVLARAKDSCLVSHSLKGGFQFEGFVDVAESTEAA